MAGTVLLGSVERQSFCIGNGLCRAESQPGGLREGAGTVALVKRPRPPRNQARSVAQPGEVAKRLDNGELEGLSGVRVTGWTPPRADSGRHAHRAAFRERRVPRPIGGPVWRKSPATKARPLRHAITIGAERSDSSASGNMRGVTRPGVFPVCKLIRSPSYQPR